MKQDVREALAYAQHVARNRNLARGDRALVAGNDIPPEQQAHMTGAAMRSVFSWLESVFDHDDLAAAWPLTDAPLRLALVQSWVLVAHDAPDDELANALAAERPTDSRWPDFASWRVGRWRRVLPPFVADPNRRGFVSIPQFVAPDLEAVLVADSGGTGRDLTGGDAVPVQRFLVRHTDAGALVAGIGGVLPIPGWPPSETSRFPI